MVVASRHKAMMACDARQATKKGPFKQRRFNSFEKSKCRLWYVTDPREG